MHRTASTLLHALAALALSTTAQATTIVIDPGPIGSSYTSVDFAFTDLDGIVASGQTISVDFIFPSGVDAVYRYDDVGTQTLYGWYAGLTFTGGTTVTTAPYLSGVVPIDSSGTAVAPYVGTITLYNATFSGYNANYNSTYSAANLLAFEDVPYHGVRMDIRLPEYAEAGVVVSSGTFGFRRNGSGESTEIIAAVPEADAALLLALGWATLSASRATRRTG